VRARRDEMGVQDRLNQVLETDALANQLRAARNLPSQSQGPLIGHPDLWEETGDVELRQHRSINGVGLDLGVRDHPHLLRIGDHHAIDKGSQQFGDAGCVPVASITTWSS
jgi:hypothetical protein